MLSREGDIQDLAARCIRCGFCLESCPTFSLTGEETESPRGRINLIKSADAGVVSWESTRPHLDKCLGCRACETACPSGVAYASLLEIARAKLKPSLKQRLVLAVATRPWLLRLLLPLSGTKRPSPASPVPRSTVDNSKSSIQEVVLLEGCAMRVLFPHVHRSSRSLLERAGYGVAGVDLGCCGALEGHAGLGGIGQVKALRTLELGRNRPIVVDSAGCGAWLKSHSSPGTVFDLSEFLLEAGLDRHLSQGSFPHRVTYHDACHLAHGQGIREAPRTLLRAIPDLDLVPLRDADRCCGSAGIYSVIQPKVAELLRTEKLARAKETGAEFLVQGNPGCHSWLSQSATGVQVVHLAEVLDAALQGR